MTRTRRLSIVLVLNLALLAGLLVVGFHAVSLLIEILQALQAHARGAARPSARP